jgi:hypothetical protein
MIMDNQAYFSDPQTVTTGTDTGLTSEHVYDLGLAAREVGPGAPLFVVVIVTTAFTSSGNNESLHVNLITDDNESMSSATEVQRLATIPAASAAGTKVVGVIAPAPGVALERYIALQYKTGGDGTALTAGAVKAFITSNPDVYKSYASGYEVS